MSNRVNEEGGLHTYRTETPNIIYELGLTAYEHALYGVLKRTAGDSGKCWKSTEKLAAESGMSVGMVSKVKASLSNPRKELGGKSLIAITEEESKAGGLPRHIITITDIWPENFRKFYSPHEQACSPHEQACSPHEQACSPHELKKITNKKNTVKKVLPAAQDTPVPDEDKPAHRKEIPFDEQTPQQRRFTLLCWIVGFDYKAITQEDSGAIAQCLGILAKAGYDKEEHLRDFWGKVWTKDWRYKKEGRHPKLSEVRAEIGKLTLSASMPGQKANSAADWTGVPSYMLQQQESFYVT